MNADFSNWKLGTHVSLDIFCVCRKDKRVVTGAEKEKSNWKVVEIEASTKKRQKFEAIETLKSKFDEAALKSFKMFSNFNSQIYF